MIGKINCNLMLVLLLKQDKGVVDTPTDQIKRNVKAGPMLQSPYTTKFGSSSSYSEYQLVSGHCPIDNNLGDVEKFQYDGEFKDWLSIGLKLRNK